MFELLEINVTMINVTIFLVCFTLSATLLAGILGTLFKKKETENVEYKIAELNTKEFLKFLENQGEEDDTSK